LAYFYFDFREAEKQDVAILLRSLIRQLCANEPEFPQAVQTMYTQNETLGHGPTVNELTSVLFSIIDSMRTEVYIIMDALDEYPENSTKSKRQELLDQIKQMVEHGSENLHLLATSRRVYDIEATLGKLATAEICIQNSQVDADIMLYVQNFLATDKALKRFPDKQKSDVEEKVGRGAHGM
jgi:hypothetical protein